MLDLVPIDEPTPLDAFPPPPTKPLRSYQLAAVEGVLAAWDRGVRATMLVLATGTGKTRTAAEIVGRRAAYGRTLWLAHRSELLDQAAGEIGRLTGLRVGREQGQSRARVRALWAHDDQVVVGSVQTMHSERLTRYFRPDDFATIVVDECHHAPAKSYRDVISYFASARVLGLTATPDRTDGLAMGNVFGDVAHRYDIVDGIRDGHLCPITSREVVVAQLDIRAAKTLAGDISASDIARALEVDGAMHAIAGPLVRLAESRPTIVFCPDVSSAQHLGDIISHYSDRPARVVHGAMPAATRADALRAYQVGETQFIVNCAVLTEGFDAPHTSCVAIVRPTKSRSLYAQMIGRGTRLSPGKSDCLVLDFTPGQAGRHKLVTPFDVLAGRDIDAETIKVARARAAGGATDLEALAEAEAEIAEKERVRRERDDAKRRKIKLNADYQVKAIDPFGATSHSEPSGKRATANTRAELLRWMGVEAERDARKRTAMERDVASIDEAYARDMIASLRDRARAGLATYRQARVLSRARLRTDLLRSDASQAIDALAAAGWVATPEIKARWGA